MGARLLAVALDLLAPTLIARPRYPTSLLHGERFLGFGIGEGVVAHVDVGIGVLRREVGGIRILVGVMEGIVGIVLVHIVGRSGVERGRSGHDERGGPEWRASCKGKKRKRPEKKRQRVVGSYCRYPWWVCDTSDRDGRKAKRFELRRGKES